MRVSAFFVSNGFLTIMSKYSVAYFFKIVKWLAAFLPDLRGRGILPPIDEDDLIVLIDNPDYKENEYLDYKETFSFLQIKDKTQRNPKKVEFKNDVCSFANAEGGYLIFGVSDNNGCASELIGIDIPNDDIDRFELDRRNDLMGIQPKMPHLDFKFIKLKNGKYVVIIYIKHDSFAPYIHLEDQKNYKIYKRVGNRKDVLPYVELKNMFNQSIALDKEIYTYRNERIDYYASQTETEGDNYSRFLLFHIIPENFTDINYNKEMFILQKTKGIRFSSIFSQFGCAPFSVPCVDGLRFLPYSPARSNAEGYINNNGIVECFLPLSEDIKLNASSQYPQGYLPKTSFGIK